ncbi:hypothetical protein MTO96_028191 [Rhipicephalus appendiculatus]
MVAWSHVWRPGLDQDIAHMVQSCQVCQEHQRASRQVEITPWPFRQRPSSRLHVLPATVPSADATIAALQQVFTTQGLPQVIVCANEPAFAGAEYLAWLMKNGIRRMMVPPYHPASNGGA